MLSRLLLLLAVPLLGSVATRVELACHHSLPALSSGRGCVNVITLTDKVAAEVKIARSWKPGALKGDGCRTGSEKGFRP